MNVKIEIPIDTPTGERGGGGNRERGRRQRNNRGR